MNRRNSIRALGAMALALLPLLAHGEPDGVRQRELLHLVRHDCGSCHGMTLKGGLGPPLLPEYLAGKPVAFLRATILAGRVGTPMPPWQGLISEEEADWLVTRLQEGKLND